jgi:hypothetical protein
MSIGRRIACDTARAVEDRSPPEKLIVLVAGDAYEDAACELLRAAASACGTPSSIERSERNLRDAISEARAADRSVALLYIAADEEDALAAIEAGADEAATFAPYDLQRVDRIVRRALTRAQTRRFTEQLYGMHG